jgi:hypothetical protein
MSTRTIYKRIALVAVAALGAGVLSVAPANAAITAPTNLTCTEVGDGSISLSWTAPTVNSTGTNDTSVASYTYSTNGTDYIALPTGGGAATTVRTITTVSATGTAGLANGTAYSITLKGVSNVPTTSAASSAVICTPGVPEPGQMFISTAASTTGAAAQASGLSVGATSLGWITQTSTTAASKYSGLVLSGGTAAAGLVNTGAKIAFNATSTVTNLDSLGVVVTGGTISGFACLNAGTASLTGATTTAVCAQAGTTRSTAYGVFNVSAAVGSTATISVYKGTSIAGTSSARNGALVGTWTFTVASASASGVYAASTSTVTTQAPVTKGTVAAGTAAFDNTDRIANGSVGIIYMELDDAYSANITGGVVAATATNGSTVVVADASSDTGSEAYAASSSFNTLSAAVAEMYVYVNQPVANTAGSTTVTITHDGVNVGTKTLNWSGDIASIAILSSTATSFANGATAACNAATSPAGAAGNVVYSARDAAGNAVSLAVSPTVTGATGALLGATVGSGDSATAAHGCVRQTSALGYGVTTMIVPSTTLQGAGTFKLRVQNSAGVNIDSAASNATVSNGSTNSFVASWDKATVAPGDLVKLTIKALDEKGNPMAAGNVNTGLSLSVASGLTAVGTACEATTLMNSAGEISCQYAAGNTAGAYSFSIDLTTATPQSATVGSVKVASATVTTSNEDVLKAIVSLIASINKQIAALQKALLRR